MDFLIFFLFLFFSVSLLLFYYKLGVLYLGIGAGAIFIIVGVLLAITGSDLSATYCFSDKVNQTLYTETVQGLANFTAYEYDITCQTESLPVDRNILNLVALMLIITGMGIVADVYRVFTSKDYS